MEQIFKSLLANQAILTDHLETTIGTLVGASFISLVAGALLGIVCSAFALSRNIIFTPIAFLVQLVAGTVSLFPLIVIIFLIAAVGDFRFDWDGDDLSFLILAVWGTLTFSSYVYANLQNKSEDANTSTAILLGFKTTVMGLLSGTVLIAFIGGDGLGALLAISFMSADLSTFYEAAITYLGLAIVIQLFFQLLLRFFRKNNREEVAMVKELKEKVSQAQANAKADINTSASQKGEGHNASSKSSSTQKDDHDPFSGLIR